MHLSLRDSEALLNYGTKIKTYFAYMKAKLFRLMCIEEVDFERKEIISDDVLFRIDRIVEDTIMFHRNLCQDS